MSDSRDHTQWLLRQADFYGCLFLFREVGRQVRRWRSEMVGLSVVAHTVFDQVAPEGLGFGGNEHAGLAVPCVSPVGVLSPQPPHQLATLISPAYNAAIFSSRLSESEAST